MYIHYSALKSLTLCTGFSRDIGTTPDDLNLAVSLFFVTFVLLQPPSAAVGRWLGAKHWITIMMVDVHRTQETYFNVVQR